jgi:hypothetical protein
MNITTEKEIRRWIILFMSVLFLSGVTAIPVEWELSMISRFFPLGSRTGDWLDRVHAGFTDINRQYPFLSYGHDWLAFAHFVLALLFIGPLRDPVRNKWVISFGIMACALIIPFALIAGHFREIPFWWRLIDCSFGILGIIPLSICLKKINRIEESETKNKAYETVEFI